MLVSCILITRDRRKFIPQAIASFQSQTHSNKELVIVDNGEDSIKDLIPYGLKHVYHRVEGIQVPVGRMRNLACGISSGDLIAHWDDDDWSHPQRLHEQIRLLVGRGCSVVGYSSMYFIAEETQEAWLYQSDDYYAIGTSFLYKREYWRGNPFQDDLNIAEDNAFIVKAQRQNTLGVEWAGDRMVARIHTGNTCDKRQYMAPPMWTPWPYQNVKNLMIQQVAACG